MVAEVDATFKFESTMNEMETMGSARDGESVDVVDMVREET